jgi:hypothetical protein
MFRRKDINIGLFNPDFLWLPDIDYWLRLMKVGNIYSCEEVLSAFRIHEKMGTVKLMQNMEYKLEERNFLYYHNFISTVKNGSMRDGLKAIIYHLYSLIRNNNPQKELIDEYLSIFPNNMFLKYSLYVRALLSRLKWKLKIYSKRKRLLIFK